MATIDVVCTLKRHPVEDSENPVLRESIVVGGPIGRGAIAAGRLGGDVRMLAMCGADLFSGVLRDAIRLEPVSAKWITEPVRCSIPL